MAGRTMLRLGDFNFAVDTAAYQKYVAKYAARWPAQERLGREPALQFVGMDSPEVTLDGVVYPTFSGNRQTSIVPLREMLMTGNPCQMVTGAGAVCGFWSILNVSDTRSYFLDNGEGRKIEFSLSIKYYGPDYSGQSGGGSPVASVVKGTGAVSKSSGVSAATALSQLKQAKDMVACLPEVTDTPSLDTISSVSDAVSSIVGTVSAGVSAVGEVLVAAKKKINDAVDAIIPQPVHEAISSIQENVRELREVGLYVLDTSSAITALPYTLKDDAKPLRDVSATLRKGVRYINATADLAQFSCRSSVDELHRTGVTFEAVAGMRREGQEGRMAVASICSESAASGESLISICEELSSLTASLMQKFRQE